MKRLTLTLICCCILACPAIKGQNAPAAKQGADRNLTVRVDSLEKAIEESNTSLQKLRDSLAIVRSQREVLLDDAQKGFGRNLSFFAIVVSVIGLGVTVILAFFGYVGYIGKRAVDRFDSRLKELQKSVDDARAEASQLSALRKTTEQEIKDLKSKIPDTTLTEKLSPEMQQQLEELTKKLRKLESLGGELSAEEHFQRAKDQYYKDLFDLALLSLERAIELKPDYADAWYNRGVLLGDMNRSTKEQLAAYEKAIECKPNFAAAWSNKGVILERMNRPVEEQLASYERAIQCDSALADAWNNKGWVLLRMKRFDEALRSFSEAIRLKPDYFKALNNRSRVYALQGNKELALTDLRQVIGHDPSQREKVKKDEDFKSLWDDDDFKKLVGD